MAQQRILPGYGVVSEQGTAQRILPGYGVLSETIAAGESATPPQGNLTLSGSAPTVVVTGNHAISPPQGNLALSSQALQRLLATLRTVPQGDLVIDGKAPTVDATADGEIVVPQGDLVLDGKAPVPSIGSTRDITVPQGNLYIDWPYEPQGIDFDGTNDYLTRGADLTGNADSKNVTGSFWARFPGAFGGYIYSSTNFRFRIREQSTGIVRIIGRDTGGTVVLEIENTVSVGGANWQHFMFSSNGTSSHLYVNNVDDKTETTLTDTAIDFTQAEHSVGAHVDASDKFPGEIADLWLDIGNYLDLSVASNREKLYVNGKQPDFGSDGSGPTGVAPLVYFRGDVASWHTNKGTGGGFTENGELTAAATNPYETHAPTVQQDTPIDLVAGDLVLSSVAATVLATANHALDIPQGDLVLNSQAPTVLSGGDHARTVPQGDLVLSTLAPIVVQTTTENITVPAGDLLLSSLAPAIAVDASVSIVVPAGDLVLAAFAPTVEAKGWVTVSVNGSTWTDIEPGSTTWTIIE